MLNVYFVSNIFYFRKVFFRTTCSRYHTHTGKVFPSCTNNRIITHIVQACYSVCPVLALYDGFLVFSVPVVKLTVQLDGDDFQMPRVMVPGEVAVHTDHVYVGSLRKYSTGLNMYLNSLTVQSCTAHLRWGVLCAYFGSCIHTEINLKRSFSHFLLPRTTYSVRKKNPNSWAPIDRTNSFLRGD